MYIAAVAGDKIRPRACLLACQACLYESINAGIAADLGSLGTFSLRGRFLDVAPELHEAGKHGRRH
jgi:hypothetical protein